MRISIVGAFLAAGVPGMTGCSGPFSSCYEGTVGTADLYERVEGDDDLTLAECEKLCLQVQGGEMTELDRCFIEDLEGADTAGTGPYYTLVCEGVYAEACVGGRRPPGLRSLRRDTPELQRMAWMEAASVHAFVRLHRELTMHGAPVDLAARCLAAARDEVSHARALAGLAGAPVPRPRIEALPLRDLDTLALDNAVEGCVHETWAAVDAHLRARRGPHRAVWARIAADETRHAQLAWDIDAWLSTRGAARPDARRQAAANLVKRVPRSQKPLARAISGRLWS